MKKIWIIGLILLAISCKPQNKKQIDLEKIKHYQMENKHEYSNLITNDFETFDIEKFYKNNNEGLGKTYDLSKNIKIEESAGEKGSWFLQNELNNVSLYSISKEFYNSGIIKSKGPKFKDDFQIGIWYDFDENGKLIKKIDLDAPFKINIEDIVAFLKENEADLFSNQTSVNRFYDEETKKGTWSLVYKGKYKDKLGMYNIKIDDSSSEIILVVKILGKEGEKEIIFEK